MKKVFVLALVIILMVALAVPAFAAAGTGSPAATEKDLVPELITASCDTILIQSAEEVEAEAQKVMEEAKEKLPEVAPEGMAAKYFFYVDICEKCENSTGEFEIGEYEEVVFMQYVNGEWVELEYTVNADGTYTVFKLVDGPVVVFVK